MSMYTITKGDAEHRAAVTNWLAGLDLVETEMRERIVTAWVTTWTSSTHAAIADMPYSLLAPGYQLAKHVNEVTRAGIALAKRATEEWNDKFDPAILMPILILHDVDKPLLYMRREGKVVGTPLSRELPHGVVGAMLLRELGFAEPVVNVVATHAANAPFHGSTREAHLLHYADFFCTDHALMEVGTQPFYQKHYA